MCDQTLCLVLVGMLCINLCIFLSRKLLNKFAYDDDEHTDDPDDEVWETVEEVSATDAKANKTHKSSCPHQHPKSQVNRMPYRHAKIHYQHLHPEQKSLNLDALRARMSKNISESHVRSSQMHLCAISTPGTPGGNTGDMWHAEFDTASKVRVPKPVVGLLVAPHE